MTASSLATLRTPRATKQPLGRFGVASAIREGRLYSFLGVLPTVSDEALIAEVDGKIRELKILADVDADADAGARARAQVKIDLQARRRLRTLLSHREWRTRYDFRHGIVRGTDRLAKAAAGEGLSVEELRRIWQRANPDLAARAAALLKSPSSARLIEAAPLDPFHPLIVAIAGPIVRPAAAAATTTTTTAETSSEWECATTPMHLSWDGGAPACVVGRMLSEGSSPAAQSAGTVTSSRGPAFREAMDEQPDGLWVNLEQFGMVELLQSLARAGTVVDMHLRHGGASRGRLLVDDRVIVHATNADAAGEEALFSLF